MTVTDMASIADVIGAVAIVVSLIYVGVQVNDSTRAVRSATANETSAALSSWYSELGNSQQASEVFWKGMTSPESLSPEESFQFYWDQRGSVFKPGFRRLVNGILASGSTNQSFERLYRSSGSPADS